MSKYVIDSETLTDIADAIRSKTGGSGAIATEDMADEIEGIPSGGGGLTLQDIASIAWYGGSTYYNDNISGAIDITVYATRSWAFTETAITSVKVRTTGSVSGYGIRERTFSNCRFLTDALYFPANTGSGIGIYAFQNCPSLTRVRIAGDLGATNIVNNAFGSCANLTDIYVTWAQGAVNNAPWGATNATIHYNTEFDSDGNIVE